MTYQLQSTTRSLAATIERYSKIARPIIRQAWRPDCCIAATAVTCGVFRALGYEVKPLPCRVLVFNQAFIDRCEREGRVPQGQKELHEFTDDGKCWSLGIGFNAQMNVPLVNGYDGHLVAIVEGWLVDASIEQANRPAKGIIFPPVLAIKAPATFSRPEFRRNRKLILNVDGNSLTYEPRRNDRAWAEAPDWQDADRHRPIIAQILANL